MPRPITLNGLTLQFDFVPAANGVSTFNNDTIMQAQSMLGVINEFLAQRFPDAQPQIMVTGGGEIDIENIEVGEDHFMAVDDDVLPPPTPEGEQLLKKLFA